MPNFTVDEIREAMNFPANIRNLSVVAHVDHGKTTLSDSLVAKAGIIAMKNAGDQCFMMGRADEQERGITIKSAPVSLYYKCDMEDGKGEQGYLMNLIDSPGHIDFSSEVTAALRVTDGALVVIDCIEGCAVQTETVLRQALGDRVKPVLHLNKVDRCILELQMDAEDMYIRFRKSIEDVNVIIATYCDTLMGDVQVSPEHGTVSFGSGLHGWAFKLDIFAKFYETKFGMQKDKMMKRLWGENFFNQEKGVWSNVYSGAPQKRGFVKFVLEPIINLIKAVLNDEKEKYEKMLNNLNIQLKGDDKALTGKPLMKNIMQKWLPAADCLIHMVVQHLPSPVVSQKYRVHNLYEGPMDDEGAKAIRNCDPKGPVVMYVSKMIPTPDRQRFYAFGRVFSGTITTGKKYRIQGPNYVPGSKTDLAIKDIQKINLIMGHKVEHISDVPCGNTCGLVGIDGFVVKTCTITDIEDAHNIAQMKYSVSPVVRVAVRPKDGKDLPKLIDGLKQLAKSDPLVVCTQEESGEHIIAGCGELHVEICLKDLRDDFSKGIEIITSDPVVSYRETVTTESSQVALSKSPNKHNRLYMKAEPLHEELSTAIERGDNGAKADPKERVRVYVDKYDWDPNHAKKIWGFGPVTNGPNVIVDVTQGVQFMNEIKDHVNSAFQMTTSQGPLCEENMRGIRFNILDVTMHTDAIHRGGGQITPAARRCIYAAEIMATPTLQEPIFLVEISCPRDAMSGVYTCLTLRRGHVFEEHQREGTPMMQAKAFLPVAESFGFTADLRQATSGQAFPQCVFDHWENVPGCAMDAGTKAQEIMLAIRKRKNLKVEPPVLSDYLDKL